MNDKKFVFQRYQSHDISLTILQIELLCIIGYIGFADFKDINMYWQLLQPVNDNYKNVAISYHTLSNWSKHGSLLLKKPVERHIVYKLTPRAKQFLIDNNLIDSLDVGLRNINIHNFMLNHAVVSGIYHTFLSLFTEYGCNDERSFDNGFSYIDYYVKKNNQFLINQVYPLPHFLHNIDIRTYNIQLGNSYQDVTKMYLKPDALISIDNVRLYFELDNLTESNNILINKIKDYIQYAHQDVMQNRQMYMLLIFNDGSVKNKHVTKNKIPTKKINNIFEYFINDDMYLDNKKMKVFKAYNQVPNLHVYMTSLNDSWVDVYDALLGNNTNQIVDETKMINKWNTNHPFLQLITNQMLPPNNRYLYNCYRAQFGITNDTKTSPTFTLIKGQEHALDTMVSTYALVHQANKKQQSYPIVIYPYRYHTDNDIAVNISKYLLNKNEKHYYYPNEYHFDKVGILKPNNNTNQIKYVISLDNELNPMINVNIHN